MRSARSDDGSPGCLYTPRAPHLWFLTRPTPFTRWAVTSTLRMRYPVTPPEWGSSGLNTAMAFLFPLHPLCPGWGVQASMGGGVRRRAFRGLPSTPSRCLWAQGGAQPVPVGCQGLRLPGWWQFTASEPSLSGTLHPPARGRGTGGRDELGGPIGACGLRQLLWGVNFLWCLPFQLLFHQFS